MRPRGWQRGAPFLLLLALAITAGKASARTLCFDEAHRNVHTSTGSYAAFAELARGLGYEVVPLGEAWTESRLEHCDLLVSVSPRGAGRESTLEERARAAFNEGEVSAVLKWISRGGSCLLVTDHAPIGSAVQKLARPLGVDMSNAFTEDEEHVDPVGGHLVFSRSDGLLAWHPILDGREADEQVQVVGTFLGQSLAGPPGSVNLLRLGPRAKDRIRKSTERSWLPPSPADVLRPAGGRSQAIAFPYGSGRVVVLGEAAMFASRGTDSGFDTPGLDNRQLAINVLRWLAGEL